MFCTLFEASVYCILDGNFRFYRLNDHHGLFQIHVPKLKSSLTSFIFWVGIYRLSLRFSLISLSVLTFFPKLKSMFLVCLQIPLFFPRFELLTEVQDLSSSFTREKSFQLRFLFLDISRTALASYNFYFRTTVFLQVGVHTEIVSLSASGCITSNGAFLVPVPKLACTGNGDQFPLLSASLQIDSCWKSLLKSTATCMPFN